MLPPVVSQVMGLMRDVAAAKENVTAAKARMTRKQELRAKVSCVRVSCL